MHGYINGKYIKDFGWQPAYETKEIKNRYKNNIEEHWKKLGWKPIQDPANHQKKQYSQTMNYNNLNLLNNTQTQNNNKDNNSIYNDNDILNNYYFSRWRQFDAESALHTHWKAKNPNYQPVLSKGYEIANKQDDIRTKNQERFNSYYNSYIDLENYKKILNEKYDILLNKQKKYKNNTQIYNNTNNQLNNTINQLNLRNVVFVPYYIGYQS